MATWTWTFPVVWVLAAKVTCKKVQNFCNFCSNFQEIPEFLENFRRAKIISRNSKKNQRKFTSVRCPASNSKVKPLSPSILKFSLFIAHDTWIFSEDSHYVRMTSSPVSSCQTGSGPSRRDLVRLHNSKILGGTAWQKEEVHFWVSFRKVRICQDRWWLSPIFYTWLEISWNFHNPKEEKWLSKILMMVKRRIVLELYLDAHMLSLRLCRKIELNFREQSRM